jgi:type II secretory pathway component PulC
MSPDINVIWRKGDENMPEKVKHVVLAAQDELLLRSLKLPYEIVDTIRYNASKSNQTINDYISTIVLHHIQPA